MKTNILLTLALFVACCVISCQHRQQTIKELRHLNYSSVATAHTDVYGSATATEESLQKIADAYESKIVALGQEIGREVTGDFFEESNFYTVYILDKDNDETVLTINAYDFETVRKFVKKAPISLLK
jgi:hypothetical protein